MTPETSSLLNGLGALSARSRAARLAEQQAPPEAQQRLRLRRAAEAETAAFNGGPAPGGDQLEQAAARVIRHEDLDERYLGFAMVMISNAYWADRLRAVPPSRRLLLLPRCIDAHDSPCPDGPAGADLHALCDRAVQLGYHVLVADGTPAVLKTLAEQRVEGILGLACLESLAAVFEKIWRLGVPAVAVPLLRGGCKDTAADLAWLRDYLEDYQPGQTPPPGGYLHLLRASAAVFEPPRLEELLGSALHRGGGEALDATGQIARDWLVAGGKRLRPFVTLAAAAALHDGPADQPPTDAACRVALAIEAFHKASLVHDDIEDDDETRYGQPTLHRLHGLPMAINVGDFLLGLGYRLLAATAGECPPATMAALLDRMSRAHVLLAQGQGAELAWRRAGQVAPSPAEALKVYALKTAPAFEAALGSGMLLGGADGEQDERLRQFARHVGVGFQILNDLDDWADDCAAARPTYLTALAAASAPADQREALIEQIRSAGTDRARIEALGRRLEQLGVFAQARQLLAALRERAVELAGQFRPTALAALCGFLVELILDDSPKPNAE